MTKRCNVCRLILPLSDFPRRAASRDGIGYTCNSCCKERNRINYKSSTEAYKKRAKKWSLENPERRKEIATTWDRLHYKHKAEYMRKWRKANIELSREQGRRHQALRRSRAFDIGVVPKKWWDALLEVFEDGVCIYCGERGHKLTMDHFMPVKLGGRTEIGNLVPCCKSCNSRKGAKTPSQYFSAETYNSICLFLDVTRSAFDDEAAQGMPITEVRA